MEYILKGGVVLHKCPPPYKDGICDFKTGNEGITTVECRACGCYRSISEFVEMFKLTEQEKKWILDEIECSVDSVRIDDNYGTITFDEKNFGAGGYIKYKIKMLSDLYSKLIGK